MLLDVRMPSPEDVRHHELRRALDRPLIERLLACGEAELVGVAADIGLPVGGLSLQELRDALFRYFRTHAASASASAAALVMPAMPAMPEMPAMYTPAAKPPSTALPVAADRHAETVMQLQAGT